MTNYKTELSALEQAGILNTKRPPFSLDKTADAATLGQIFADSYRRLTQLKRPPLSIIINHLMDQLEIQPSAPIRQAANSLSRKMDQGLFDNPKAVYHNSFHHVEVLMNAHYLMLISRDQNPNNFCKEDHAQLLLAALAHDLGHDGGTNKDIPFRLEQRSVNLLIPYMRQAKVPELQQQAIGKMILATAATGFVKQIFASHQNIQPPPTAKNEEQQLSSLQKDKKLAHLCCLLMDADHMPSAAFTIENGLEKSPQLANEWNKPVDAKSFLFFIDTVMAGRLTTPAAQIFNQNVERLRANAIQRADYLARGLTIPARTCYPQRKSNHFKKRHRRQGLSR